jgi:cobalamin biosynthesis Mg chelatase CobN
MVYRIYTRTQAYPVCSPYPGAPAPTLGAAEKLAANLASCDLSPNVNSYAVFDITGIMVADFPRGYVAPDSTPMRNLADYPEELARVLGEARRKIASQ